MRLTITKSRHRWAINRDNGKLVERCISFQDAAAFAHAHLQRHAVKRLMREVIESPGEYHGLDLHLIPGDTTDRKITTLHDAATYRGHKITCSIEDGTIYVRYVERGSLEHRLDQLDNLPGQAAELEDALAALRRWESIANEVRDAHS
jgi:hypothetical protein